MNNKKTTILSAIASYGALQVKAKQIDPYTRAALGTFAGFMLTMSGNNLLKMMGIGTMIASAFQLLDTLQGGKLVKNDSAKKVTVLDQKNGLVVLEKGQTPAYTTDGFTIEGMNAVFKVADGVFVQILNDSTICYSPGFSMFVNHHLRNAGLKDKTWVDQQTDLRWKALYLKSIH